VPLSIMKGVGELLIDMHGQNEHQLLLSLRWPNTKFRACRRIDLQAPVSPVTVLMPDSKDKSSASTTAKFLTDNWDNIVLQWSLR
jgi:hypothetical protein